MKRSLLLLVITSILPVFSFGQWSQLADSVQFNEGALAVVNKDTLFVSSYYGSLINKSTDGGQSWESPDSFYNVAFNQIQFLNDSVGIIGGGAPFLTEPTFYKTSDCGATWDTIQYGIGSALAAHFYFLSPDTGFILNTSGGMDRTIDGGNTFQFIPIGDSNYVWSQAIVFPDKTNGYASGLVKNDQNKYKSVIYKTINGGTTWTLVFEDDNFTGFNLARTIHKLFFPDNLNGYAAGSENIFLKTIDGGLTWINLSDRLGNQVISDLWFLDANRGYAVAGGNIYYTNDGGHSWVEQSIPANARIKSIAFAKEHIGYAIGNGLFKTINGGGNTGIEEMSIQDKIRIFPNPANGIINLDYTNLSIRDLHLSDLSGRFLKTFPSKNKVLNVSDLASGIYFLKAKTEEGEIIKKVVIEQK